MFSCRLKFTASACQARPQLRDTVHKLAQAEWKERDCKWWLKSWKLQLSPTQLIQCILFLNVFSQFCLISTSFIKRYVSKPLGLKVQSPMLKLHKNSQDDQIVLVGSHGYTLLICSCQMLGRQTIILSNSNIYFTIQCIFPMTTYESD